VRLDRDMEAEKLASRLVLQVHDEVIVEMARGRRTTCTASTESALTGAADLRVPLTISVQPDPAGPPPRAERRGLSGRRWAAGENRPGQLITVAGLAAGTGGGATIFLELTPARSCGCKSHPSQGAFPMADAARTSLLSPEAMGSFDAEGNYTPRTIVDDDLGDADLEKAMVTPSLSFDDGDVIEGTVRQDRPRRGPPRHRLQVRRGHPRPRALHPHDVDPSEDRVASATTSSLVLQKEDKEGRLVLSKKRASTSGPGRPSKRRRTTARMVSVPVIEVVKGGLIVDIGLRGFLPASLVELRRVRELQPYVGKVIEAKIIELDRNRNNVVLSRRAWLGRGPEGATGRLLANLKPGERRKGCRLLGGRRCFQLSSRTWTSPSSRRRSRRPRS